MKFVYHEMDLGYPQLQNFRIICKQPKGPWVAVGEIGTYCPDPFSVAASNNRDQQTVAHLQDRKVATYEEPGVRAALTQRGYVAKMKEVEISIQQKHQYTCSSAGKTVCQGSRKTIFGEVPGKTQPFTTISSHSQALVPEMTWDKCDFISEGPVGQLS